eukprot:gene14922-17116_t
MEQLGASYFQGSYIQGGRQVSGTLADNSALRDACERIERIEKVIDGNYPLARDICQPCLYDVSRKVDRHIREANRVKKAYDDVLEQSSGAHKIPKAVPSSTSRAIDQYLQSVDLAHLIAASEDLARDIQQLEDDERRLSKQESTSCVERRKLLHLLSQQSLEEADLEYQLCRYEQTLPRLHMLLDASGLELNYLQQQKRQNISNNMPISLSPLFDPVQVYRSQYGILNGRRLAYVEQPQCKLMWGEINASWSNLATMLLCIRNSRRLPNGVHLQKAHNLLYQALCADITSHNQPSSSIQPVYQYTHILHLRPFIDHTLLQVHCTRTHSINHTDMHNTNNNPHYYAHSTHKPTVNNTNLHSANQKETATREFVLHLEGGVHSAAQEKERSKSRPLSGYDDTSSTNREYRTAVLTLACAVVGTILEIHYENREDTNSIGKPSSKHSPARSTFTEEKIYKDNMLQGVTLLDSLFDGLLRDLACALITIGDQLSFAVPQHTTHPRTMYTSNIGHTSRANLTSNGFTINTINSTYPATNDKNSPSTETVNVDIVNASTLASSVLANSTLLRTTLFDSVAYFGAYTGIMGPTTAAPTTTVDNNTNNKTNNNNYANNYPNPNTSTRPGAGEFTPPRRVVSTTNSPMKPSERVAYDTISSPSNPDTPHIADSDSPDNHTSSNTTVEKYQRKVQLLQEYKYYCVQTNTKCDIYSALLVCSEVELREVEVMQKLVIDLMNTLSKNFHPSV